MTDPLIKHHRRRRGTLLVWALTCTLLAVIAAGAARLGWWDRADAAGFLLGIIALIVLVIWFIRARSLTRQALARRLDAEWQLSARLESAQELAAANTPFATALKTDATNRIASQKLPFSVWWHGGLTLLIVAMLFAVSEITLLGWRLIASPPEVEQPAGLAEDISATIDWRKPDSEIKATAIEEIPLQASAATATGFRSLTLEVSINGSPALSRPLAPEAMKPLAQAGSHEIGLSLYLDEIEAHPYDIVAYHLLADRATATPAPPVSSPLQFIQIRPARDDVAIMKMQAGDGASEQAVALFQLSNLVGALKAAQLALLKQNFLLAHAPLEKSDPLWKEENTRVAADQTTFTGKIGEARDFAINEGLPVIVVDNLGQITPLSTQSAELITSTENLAATPLQGKSLGLITDIERIIRKVILEIEGQGQADAGQSPSGPEDPFKDEQKFPMKPRQQTAAGQLEELAEQQAREADQTDEPADSPQETPAQRQADLAAELARLAASGKLNPSAQRNTEKAALDAAKAAEQLKQNDAAAARAPAAAAAEELRQALEAQEAAGRATALAQLDAARRALNAAAGIEDNAARAAALAAIAEQLAAEASAQQESGSAKAAQQLNQAAREAASAARAAREGTDRQPAPSGQEPGSSANAETQPGSQGEQGQQGQSGQQGPTGSEGQSGTSPSQSPSSGKTSSDSTNARGGSPGEGRADGQRPGPTPLDSATETAAQAELALAGYRASLERAIRQLQSGSQPGDGPGETSTLTQRDLQNIELATQLAEHLLPSGTASSQTSQINEELQRLGGAANVIMPASLDSAVDQLRLMLQAQLGSDQRDEIVRRYNPDDIPPAYRDAVKRYFEELSRGDTR